MAKPKLRPGRNHRFNPRKTGQRPTPCDKDPGHQRMVRTGCAGFPRMRLKRRKKKA
jgi:hypothetical protein